MQLQSTPCLIHGYATAPVWVSLLGRAHSRSTTVPEAPQNRVLYPWGAQWVANRVEGNQKPIPNTHSAPNRAGDIERPLNLSGAFRYGISRCNWVACGSHQVDLKPTSIPSPALPLVRSSKAMLPQLPCCCARTYPPVAPVSALQHMCTAMAPSSPGPFADSFR